MAIPCGRDVQSLADRASQLPRRDDADVVAGCGIDDGARHYFLAVAHFRFSRSSTI